MRLYSLFILIAMISLTYSAVGPEQVKLLEPYPQIVDNGDVIDLGYIGPGQTFSIMISTKVDYGGIYNLGGNWDHLYSIDLPDGWTASKSSFGPKLKINVKAPPDVKEGIYNLTFVVEDDGHQEEIGDKLVFQGQIEVKKNLVNLKVAPAEQTVSAGSPARFKIMIENPSTASEVFTVRAKGVPGWNLERDVFIPFRGSTEFYYEIVNYEEDSIPVTIEVVSHSSPQIRDESKIQLITKSDPFYDLLSTNNGLLLYPPMEFLLYGSYQLIASILELN